MELRSLGILVNDLAYSQLNYNLIQQCNRLIDCSPIVFTKNNYKPCTKTDFAIMDMAEAWHYKAPIVATNIKLASQLLNFVSIEPKFLYVWDLEWMRYPPTSYESFADLYGHPQLHLICRSNSHKRLIENAWNKPVVGIIDDFDIESLIGIINNVRQTNTSK